jgi:hypothetical protein
MKGLVLLIGLVAVACVAAVYLATRKPDKQQGARDDNAELAAAPVTSVPGARAGSPAPGTSEVRRLVQDAVDRAAPSTDKAHLGAFLDGLLDRARAQGRITALESEVGREMITRVGGDADAQLAFAQRLNALAEELRREPVPPAPPAGQALDELRAIGERVRGETDTARREALIRGYIQQVATLPPEEKLQAMTRLNELAGAAAPQPPSGLDVASQWATVERAEGPARQEAIRHLMETVRRLPPKEQIEHTQRLNALVRAGEPAR